MNNDKLYAVVPTNDWAVELDAYSIPPLFLTRESANKFAEEISIDGLEYSAVQVTVNS